MNGRDEGLIVTFYSYKGGVGRTMALANVAFMAALNNLKVLVMDWDLEAPGVAYYFRGLLDAAEAKALKESPGIMDMLWDWGARMDRVRSDEDLALSLNYLASGEPFWDGVRPLLQYDQFGSNLVLDYIGAGRRVIEGGSSIAYEDALAKFSWGDFFENEAGGIFLEQLRSWAKSNYDLVIIDSRTGLADVAGICTLQMPDVVALCFVMNRQNIDGVARVSSAIRTKRQEQIAIRAVPMRVARQDTSEESDARARAISELTRIGGFSSVAVQEDMKILQVAADDSVPFYETLAPFTASDPSLHPLTLNYLRLASSLIGKELKLPTFDDSVIEVVRRRLQPRHATVEYLSKLKESEPERAISELQHLLESAYEAELEGEELDEDYVRALVEAVDHIGDLAGTIEAYDLKNKGLDLLRILCSTDSEKWKPLLIAELESIIENPMFYVGDEQMSALEELDGLLAEYPTIEMMLKRIRYRRRAARIYLTDKSADLAVQTVGEIAGLIKDVSKVSGNMASDQIEQVREAEIENYLFKGDVERLKDNLGLAYREYWAGIDRAESYEFSARVDGSSRIRSELHMRLAEGDPRFISPDEAAVHAVQAAVLGRGQYIVMFNFVNLSKAVLRCSSKPEYTLAYCEAVFDVNEIRSKMLLANYFGRQTFAASEFVSVASEMAELISTSKKIGEATSVIVSLIDTVGQVLRSIERRRRTVADKHWDTLVEKVGRLNGLAARLGIDASKYLFLSDQRSSSRPLISREKRKREEDDEI